MFSNGLCFQKTLFRRLVLHFTLSFVFSPVFSNFVSLRCDWRLDTLNNYKRTKTLGVRFLSYYMLTKNESRLFFSFISIVLLRLFAVFFKFFL